MRKILGISGKDSCAAALILKLHNPNDWAEVELFFNDTGCDYPCVHGWLRKVEAYFEKPIAFIDGDLPGAIARYTTSDRAFLPSRKVRYCTKEAKIQPMERWIGADKALLYGGFRYDEQERSGYTPSPQVDVIHPLIDHRISLGGVYALLEAVKLLPPDFFWQTLYDAVCEEWAAQPNLLHTEFKSFLSLHHKRLLFAGRSRTNCYFCFNQRLYEFVWLSETYPDLFEQACAYEKDDYTWKQGESLRELVKPDRKRKIIRDRAKAIVKVLSSVVFGAAWNLGTDSEDLYDSPSCGMFCGK